MNAAGCMKALCLAGRIILENGGETYRAEDTVRRMARALGLSEADAFAIPSGLFISFTDETGERKTSLNRVYLHGTHLARVDRVNQLSRMLADGLLDPDELYDALQEASRLGKHRPHWVMPLAAFISASGFALMFGGGWIDILIGGLCAALTQLVPYLLPKNDASTGMTATMLGGVICGLIPLAFHSLTGLGVTEAMIASAVMPLVPGLSMTNAVQDILRGDMVSGVAHCARAVMVAAMVAGGALVGTYISGLFGLSAQSASSASTLPLFAQALLMILASLLAGGGFGVLQSAPKKAVFCGGALGVAGYMSYWFVMQLGATETAAMFIGMLIAALGAQLASRRLKMITTVFVTISMMPMVPGLGLYRAMSALAQGDLALGGGIAAHTMMLILMIALGIGLASSLAGMHHHALNHRKGRKLL